MASSDPAAKVITRAEIVSVGTELLLGEIVDTNSAYLAASLAARGVDVLWSSRVGDNLGRIAEVLVSALSRSDLVVIGGGLGPTDDDLTRDAVARVVGEEQAEDPALAAWLEERFSSTGRSMPLRNLRQAMVVPSASVLANPIGTAPGWLVSTERDGERRWMVTLPGPPRELKRMWEEQAVPRLPFPTARLYAKTFKVLGPGESSVAERLGALTDGANPSVATYAKRDGVHVRVAAKAADADTARELARPVEAAVADVLGEDVWGVDEDELARLVVDRFRSAGRSLAVAEGVTGGFLSQLLTEVDDGRDAAAFESAIRGSEVALSLSGRGATGFDGTGQLAGSVIAWRAETMRTLLPDLAALARLPAGLTAATAEVVAAIALAVRTLFAADVGVAIGYPYAVPAAAGAGPDVPSRPSEEDLSKGSAPGSAQARQLRLEVAIADGEETHTTTLRLPPLGRGWARERAAFAGLHLLLRSALR